MKHAFTTRYSGLVRALRTDVGIFLPFTGEQVQTQKIEAIKYNAIWDTGATNSVITKKVVSDLGLKPISVVEMHHAGGKSLANVYLVNFVLPDNVVIGQVRVTEAQLTDTNISESNQAHILIGMDIIALGDLAVTNSNAKTTLSFRIPSLGEIDFVPGAQERNVMESGNRQQRRAMEAKKRKGSRSHFL